MRLIIKEYIIKREYQFKNSMMSNYKICNQLIQLNLKFLELRKRKANKYGNIEFETNIYSVSPKEKNSELWIKIAAK